MAIFEESELQSGSAGGVCDFDPDFRGSLHSVGLVPTCQPHCRLGRVSQRSQSRFGKMSMRLDFR